MMFLSNSDNKKRTCQRPFSELLNYLFTGFPSEITGGFGYLPAGTISDYRNCTAFWYACQIKGI